jgi:hypothetical protein
MSEIRNEWRFSLFTPNEPGESESLAKLEIGELVRDMRRTKLGIIVENLGSKIKVLWLNP